MPDFDSWVGLIGAPASHKTGHLIQIYPLLTTPRALARAHVQKYGHPEKLKYVPFEPGPFYRNETSFR
jgi:hypothetical protein